MKKSQMTSIILDNISNKLSNRRFSSEKGKALIVFTGSSLEVERTMENIFELKQSGYDVAVGFSFMAENLIDTKRIINSLNPLEVLGEEDLLRLQIIANDYCLLFMPNITMNTLSKVCSGMVDSFASNILWTFLYKNKKVIIDFYSVRNYLGEKPASNEIEKMIEEKIDTIIRMGAVEFERRAKEKLKNDEIRPRVKDLSRELITEKDIIHYKNSKLTISKNTIITPLAKDRARELNIEIIVE